MERYKRLQKLGSGAFGEVILAEDSRTGDVVAIKQLFVRTPSARERVHDVSREVRVHQSVAPHDCVIPLREVVWEGTRVHLVMPAMSADLHDLVDSTAARGLLPEDIIKKIAQMLLDGLRHLHSAGIAHRDVKPGNCLLHSSGQLCIGDFGLARRMPHLDSFARTRDCGSACHAHHATSPPQTTSSSLIGSACSGESGTSPCCCRSAGSVEEGDDKELTNQVASRWYRAPEVLLGSTDYSLAVDIWAAGCVIAELFELSPLAPGASDLDQILRVVQVRGTPTPADWPDVASLPDYGKLLLPDVAKPPLGRFVPNAPSAALDLLERMLAYDPSARPNAAEVLAHPWFTMDPAPAALGGLVPAVAAASARRADAASRIPPLETVLLHSHSSSER